MELSSKLSITHAQAELLDNILRQYIPSADVWAYGSRVKGSCRPYSDLDLVAFVPKSDKRTISDLRDALDESNLPFMVDLHLWDELPDSFHEIIKQNYVPLQHTDNAGARLTTPNTLA